ncbi:hypothetical protein [Streptomyces sp. HC307]
MSGTPVLTDVGADVRSVQVVGAFGHLLRELQTAVAAVEAVSPGTWS